MHYDGDGPLDTDPGPGDSRHPDLHDVIPGWTEVEIQADRVAAWKKES